MEQRRLRLGDILDDYCPRERRVTNHAIVAMIEDDIKQTRCTTCDAEHPYKGARVPKRRKKESPVVAGALALTADVTPSMDAVATDAVAALAPRREDAELSMHNDEDDPRMPSGSPSPTPAEQIASRESESAAADQDSEPHADIEETPAVEGPVHRPLIRATLPRPEGQKDARPLPDFTVRHSPARGQGGHGNFRGERMRLRGGNGSGNGHDGNGNRAYGGGSRFQGQGNRPSGQGRSPMGRGGAPSGFRTGNAGPSGKRGRGSRG
ncbi:MAG: hypothetical protein ACRD1U_02255 [Vicinamibacterales bacterium]